MPRIDNSTTHHVKHTKSVSHCNCFSLLLFCGFMEGARRRRSSKTRTITRIYNKLQRAQTGDESLLVVPQLERYLDSLATAFSCYKAVHQEVADGFPEQINPEEEDQALEQQSDTVEEAEILGQLLVSITSATQKFPTTSYTQAFQHASSNDIHSHDE